MKRSPIARGDSELKRTAMKRADNIRARRATPRRREAPRWTAEEWRDATTALLARSGGMCERCGKPLAGRAERAHRVRRRDGGDSLAQILLLHPECHAWTHSHPVEAGALGLILRTTQDPLTMPVLWCGTVWVMLGDDGLVAPTEAPDGN